jgi:succinate dehydrogenase / fumarate reductase cytochrome b subunit
MGVPHVLKVMSNFSMVWWSSVGRKVLMAITGLGLFGFVAAHLVGNLTLLIGADAFNAYAYFLEHLGHGFVLYLFEAGLIAFFLLHAVSGVKVWWQKRQARRTPYEVTADAGGASRKSLASRTMILTGPVLLVFVVLHVYHFKFGPGLGEGLVTVVHGTEMRDLYRLVMHEFNKAPVVLAYAAAMIFLGFHLVHGFWSGLQSLGAANERVLPVLTAVSFALGIVLAFGFLYIPFHVLFLVPDPGLPVPVGVAQLPVGGLP